MKIKNTLLTILLCVGFFSCNDGEGPGGTSSIEGYIYQIRYPADDSSFQADTIPAVKEDVYIIYGDNDAAPLDDSSEETNNDGLYRFSNLRDGNYIISSFSTFDDGTKEQVSVKVNVSGKHNKADTIYIHTGKAAGTAMIKGQVYVTYYNKGSIVYTNGQAELPALGTRVYIKKYGQDVIKDDVRTDNNGIFVFQRLPAGTYEIYTETEVRGDAYKNVLLPTESQIIEIPKAPYVVHELTEPFHIIINT